MLCEPAAATATQLLFVPIRTGKDSSLVVPFPKAPWAFDPHAHNVPLVFKARLCSGALAMAAQSGSGEISRRPWFWSSLVPGQAHSVPLVFKARARNPAPVIAFQSVSIPI